MNTEDLLEQAIQSLGLINGCLLEASSTPVAQNETEWVEKGDWLALAEQLGAEGIFFVRNEPVVVLARLPEGKQARHFFNDIWCMARPQFLFLVSEKGLEAYNLNSAPVRGAEELRSEDRLLAIAETIAEVQVNFKAFKRIQLETGEIYGDDRFEASAFRADRALVHDLKVVRRLLIDDGLAPEHAHSLIGRAIFIRYLEDREVLKADYFWTIAQTNETWFKLLESESVEPFAELEYKKVLLFRVLKNKGFTYALFDQLSADFNGDTFPVTSSEKRMVKARHIEMLRRLLTGDQNGQQGQLFLFAYRFDVVPIELISSIYEEFYTAREGKGNTQSSYYTPPALADYLLAQVLTKEVLDQRPRIIDPACGSGIFLVEAFRRMVRHRVSIQGRRLRQNELSCILRDQIAGIDLNPEAAQIAAFSLYLAYLHYQFPREINEHRALPNLRYAGDREDFDAGRHFNILYTGSAFEAIQHGNEIVQKRFGSGVADIVVGNPPWGDVKRDDALGRSVWPLTQAWCDAKPERIIGDKEQSQAFVHLALEMLVEGGKAAMLLSSGILFKQHENSQEFRRIWLQNSKLLQVVNFAHVRHIFFSDPARKTNQKGKRSTEGVAPFISATFEKVQPERDHRFSYWSAKRTATVENSHAIILNSSDMHWLSQDACRRDEKIWKIYWWGDRRHENLIHAIERFPALITIANNNEALKIRSGQGFKAANKDHDAEWLSSYKELPTKYFRRYGEIDPAHYQDSPPKVHRRGVQYMYEGRRLLIKRGIGKKGIVARLETIPFCFRNSIEGFRLEGFFPQDELLLLGIFWSSVAKYYFWLTAGSWGMWHDELTLQKVAELPVAVGSNEVLREKIVEIVSSLQSIDILQEHKIEELETELDDAVFDLYEMNQADRDLVRDMCNLGIDFFYNRSNSSAVSKIRFPERTFGLALDLPANSVKGIEGYLQVFLDIWNNELSPDAELAWEIIGSGGEAPVIAALFRVVSLGERPNSIGKEDDWSLVLRKLAEASYVPVDRAQSIYSDTFIRSVGAHEILIVKRNEQRHWCRSTALEDADATIVQAIRLSAQQEQEMVSE